MNSMSAGDLAKLIYDNMWIKAIASLIAANLLTGCMVALFSKKVQFYLAATGDFLVSRVVPYLIGWGAVKLVLVTSLPGYAGLSTTVEAVVSTFVIAALVGHILENLRVVFPNIPTWAGEQPPPPVDAPVGVVAVPPKVAAKPAKPAAKKPKAG